MDEIAARIRKVGDVLLWKELALDVGHFCVVAHPRPFHQPQGGKPSSMRMIINKVMILPGAALRVKRANGKKQRAERK
jgi:hypothetical protein